MDRYQLAKLVELAGVLRTRKRMQKVVYLLQAAGCPLKAGFTLHHYGPYSAEVAHLADEMVQVDLLEEEAEENRVGKAFRYKLSEKGQIALRDYEQSAAGQRAKGLLEPYRERARDLLGRDVRELEVAATLAYFQKHERNWDRAVDKACAFKNLGHHDSLTRSALKVTQEIMQ